MLHIFVRYKGIDRVINLEHWNVRIIAAAEKNLGVHNLVILFVVSELNLK
jgi:hypothetical protein